MFACYVLQVLSGMYTIKNKITGAEFYTNGKPLRFYMTLPNIRTGANLTLTILCSMFNQRILTAR